MAEFEAGGAIYLSLPLDITINSTKTQLSLPISQLSGPGFASYI